MIISIDNLKKTFNRTIAVDIPHLTINEREIIGLVGNNGAGKTTFFRLLLDLLKADSGIINNLNCNVSTDENWKQYTGAFIDNNFLIEILTPEEYFTFIGKLHQLKVVEIKSRMMTFETFMNGEILNQKKYIHNFSAGNKQKIGIIGAMLINPQVLILDEPFNFLDPSSQIIMKQLLLEYNRKYGTTILLSSHNLQHVMDICNRIIILESGCVIRDYDMINDMNRLEINQYFENKG